MRLCEVDSRKIENADVCAKTSRTWPGSRDCRVLCGSKTSSQALCQLYRPRLDGECAGIAAESVIKTLPARVLAQARVSASLDEKRELCTLFCPPS